MPDFATFAAIIALSISVASFGFSLLNNYQQRQQDKRDMFIKMHEALLDPDLQRGRRILNSKFRTAAEFDSMQDQSPDEYQLINRCLAMFDVFAMYVDHKFIDEELVLKEWGHTIARTWEHAEPFLDARSDREHYRPWANLRSLAPRAIKWAEETPRP